MCEVMEKYEKIAAEKAAKEATEKAEKKATEKANIKAIISMVTTFNATKSQILKLYSEDEYSLAMKEINKNV